MRRALLTCLAITTLVAGLPTGALGQQGEAILTLQVAPTPTTVARGTSTALTYTLVNTGSAPTLPQAKVLVRLPESMTCVDIDPRTNRVRGRAITGDQLTNCVDTPSTPANPALLSQNYAIITVPDVIAAADPASTADEYTFTLSVKHPLEAMARTSYQIEAGILGYQYHRNGQPVTMIPQANRACRPSHPVDDPACTLAIVDTYFPDGAGPVSADRLGTAIQTPPATATHVLSSYTQSDGRIDLSLRQQRRPIEPVLTPGDQVDLGITWIPPEGPGGGPHALYGTATEGHTVLDLLLTNVDTTGFAAGAPTALPSREQIKRAITSRLRPYYAPPETIAIEPVSPTELSIRIPFRQLPGRPFTIDLTGITVQPGGGLDVMADLRFSPVTFVHPDYPNSPRLKGEPVQPQVASMHQRLTATLSAPPPSVDPTIPEPVVPEPPEAGPTQPNPADPGPTDPSPSVPEPSVPDLGQGVPADPGPTGPDPTAPTPPGPPATGSDPVAPNPAVPEPPAADPLAADPPPLTQTPPGSMTPNPQDRDPLTPTPGAPDVVVPLPKAPELGDQHGNTQGPDQGAQQDAPDAIDRPSEHRPPVIPPVQPNPGAGLPAVPLPKERPAHLPAPPAPALAPAPATRGRLSVLEDPQLRASRWVESVVPAGQTVDTVLIGRDNVFADSLASGGLQGMLHAPLLLNSVAALGEATMASLNRLKPKQVVLLGGKDAVSLQTEAQLRALGYQVRRLYGRTRVETAINAAATFAPDATHGILARAYANPNEPNSQGFADALSGGALAAHREQPVLLTPSDELPDSLRTYFANAKITHLTLLGSTEAISPKVEAELNQLGIATTRLAGENRADTAVRVANAMGYWHAGESEAALVVNGDDEDAWTDAFPAALFAKRHNLPVVLSASTSLQPESAQWLGPGVHRNPPTRVICGYSAGPLAQCGYVPAPANP